jgi:signal transduction histidine kinase
MHIDQSDFHDQLMRGLTHRMNNILSLFHGYLGLLLDDKSLNATALDGLAQIKEGAQAATDLLDRTRELARPVSGIWQEIDVQNFLSDLRPMVQEFTSRPVELEIECEEDLAHLWADVRRLKTAVFEIIRNAIDATPDDGTVHVYARNEPRCDPEHQATSSISWVSITISDDGPGIPKKLMHKIFHPFFSTKHEDGAAGLGLTVALGLVQQLGGAIRVKSEDGHTAVRVLLPSRTHS